MTLDYTEIGSRIKKYRKAKGITQKELALATNLTPGQISHIETGLTRPNLDIIAVICFKLDVSSDEIIFGKRIISNQSLYDTIVDLVYDCSESDQRLIIEVTKTIKDELAKRDGASAKFSAK